MVVLKLVIFLNYCITSVQSAVITVYEPRRHCPSTGEKWRERVSGYICPPATQYHCMRTDQGGIVEFCSDITWIEHDYCPVFNTKTRGIDVHLCPGDAGCPRQQYLSNTVYNYPDCLQNVHTATESAVGGKSLGSSETRSGDGSVDNNAAVSVALLLTSVSLVLMAVSFTVLIVVIYSKLRIEKAVLTLDLTKPEADPKFPEKARPAGPDCKVSTSSWFSKVLRCKIFVDTE